MIKISQVPIEWAGHEAYRSVIETPKGKIECEFGVNWNPGEMMPMRLFINTTTMPTKEALDLAAVAGYFGGEFASVEELIDFQKSLYGIEANDAWPGLCRKHF